MANRYFEADSHTKLYAKYRLSPPPELIQHIISFLKEKYEGNLDLAVDVGSGSGQNTFHFSEYFQRVLGTDVSPNQIAAAKEQNTYENVSFEVSPAEKLNLENDSVQLLAAMAAVHWFDLPKFFEEGFRVLSPGGVMALYCYFFADLHWERDPSKNDRLTQVTRDIIFNTVLAQYWPPQAQLALNKYREITIPEPPFTDFCRLEDKFVTETKINLGHLFGFLQTGSGFQKYREEKGDEEAQKFIANFRKAVIEVIEEDLSEEEKASPDEIPLLQKHPFFLLLARKPSVSKSN